MNDGVTLLRREKNGAKYYACPLCGGEIKVPPLSFNGKCDICNATLIDYNPAPYQLKFHQSSAQYKLNIGGFGSGKTTMCCAEIAIHALSTPGGKSLITAPKLQQIRDAVIPELEKFLPAHMIEHATTSPNISYTLTNKHEIVVYASNDEQNLRSLSLTAFYIEEASNVDFSVFTQLSLRLRNEAAVDRNEQGEETGSHFIGLVSSNPDEGWVRNEFLLRSGKIFTSASLDRSGYDSLKSKNAEPQYHSFLSSTRDNTYLHKNYIQRATIGKSQAWIRRNIDCQLDIKEGAVYPEAKSCFIDPFPIPKDWIWIGGFDKGFRDETAMLMLVIDPKTGTVYAAEEYYEAEQPMSYHAKKIKPMLQNKILYSSIKADPTIRNRNERDGETYQNYFFSISGIYLDVGNNDIITGVEKVRDYMYLGKLKIFNTLEHTKDEIASYSYPDGKDKPSATGANHLMDCLRYAIAQLPQNPSDLAAAVYMFANSQKPFWKDEWVDVEDDVVSQGNVYIYKGGK